MANDHDVIIAGGGLNGTTLALALAQAGLRIALVDRLSAEYRSAADFDGRSYALALASSRLLGALGLWDMLNKAAQPIHEVKASDGRAGEGSSPFFLHFDRGEIEDGPMGYLVEDRFLRRVLLRAVDESPRIDHLPDETITAQTVGSHAEAETASGRTLRGRLLVGADGRQSGTAARAGIKRFERDYHQDALVCAIQHEKPHHGIAHQFFMPGGPLAILPLSQDRSSIVWSERRPLARHIASLDDAAFLAMLCPRVGDFLGDFRLCGLRFSYPLGLSMARQITDRRLALVGDAAMGVHPIAGQGLNQGLRDVGTLAEVIADANRRGEDFGASDVLARYRQWRSFDRAALAMATDGFNALFSNDNPVLRLGRDLGMSLVTAMPGLRRRLMREAAGLNGDLPRLLQGQPI
ncbi:UbiH/UbiF/VisC/COQ6 family ubiquinone biosynthesis hydroxylase [Actibacterium sp. 188UL27-1]|uniref:UbiH/UbiF/VisC/COQ6 family ubiquinone biosynthesis hydroxylase n=1 Tax=Actibacterium sp. 188UL27-1 TaxID=2786961 RepID=UPI001955FDA4|nr:UbiH/UbiF/VisC/COQ6 family ubiquinone biosynthesis hydroxylase [Actibacterium sp. 188UL27-1]MBM7065974.1 UbiH/UbiF/VisC/COQ6 family ubiquinone biosynthesis hydroxylase [Actibacterium sp. 188UL27-1]